MQLFIPFFQTSKREALDGQEKTMKQQWYSVRCIFKHPSRHDMTKRGLYEERVTIWKANSFEEAIENAELEAKEYADQTQNILG